MKKIIYSQLVALIVPIGILFTNCENKIETKPSTKQLSISNKKDPLEERKKWEASPDGMKYKKWETSSKGKKVYASYELIKKYLKEFTDMEAVVTSVTFQRENSKQSSPKWIIVRINSEQYMMQFNHKEFKQLKSLKLNDKIIVRSRNAGFSHNHPYLIISSDYISKNNKILFKRDLSKNNGC